MLVSCPRVPAPGSGGAVKLSLCPGCDGVPGGPRLILALVRQQHLPRRIAHRIKPGRDAIGYSRDNTSGISIQPQLLSRRSLQSDVLKAESFQSGVAAGGNEQLVGSEVSIAVEHQGEGVVEVPGNALCTGMQTQLDAVGAKACGHELHRFFWKGS